MIINSCNGQVNTNKSKSSPIIIGSPPPILSQPGIPLDPDLVSHYIRSIFQDSNGNYWFGPAGHSVVRYDGNSLRYYSKTEFFNGNKSISRDSITSVHAITQDQKGNIWFGTDYGAVKYDGNTFKSYTEQNGLSNINVGRRCILVDKTGTIWVGTKAGVFQYMPIIDRFAPFHLLPFIKVTDIIEDRDGLIWFASSDGIYSYDARKPEGKTIKNINDIAGLGDNYSGGMAQDKSGNYWFVMKGGICKYDKNTFTKITPQDGLGGTEFWGIHIEKSGIIWVTARGATTRYDPSIPISNPKAFTVFRPEDGINCCVQSMYQDRSGNMWWGTGQGLYRFDGRKFYQVKKNGPW